MECMGTVCHDHFCQYVTLSDPKTGLRVGLSDRDLPGDEKVALDKQGRNGAHFCVQ